MARTTKTITTAQITALRTEAHAARDYAQADLCDRALEGDAEAREACEEAIAAAAATPCGGLHVTWSSPSGGQITCCATHEEEARAARFWPRDHQGVEYCQVSRGGRASAGRCDMSAELAGR